MAQKPTTADFVTDLMNKGLICKHSLRWAAWNPPNPPYPGSFPASGYVVCLGLRIWKEKVRQINDDRQA